MTSRTLSGRTAILAAALCALANSTACDTEAVESMGSVAAILDDIYIESITTNGPGCPSVDPNTVSVVIAGDKKSFVIIYRDMQLDYPPGPSVKNLSCTAAVQLHIPQGVQISLATVNTAGYLYLDEGIKAKETSSYAFAGGNVGMYSNPFTGPYDDLYVLNDKIPFVSQVWSDCGGSAVFTIKTSLNLNAKGNLDGQAIFSTDTTDGEFHKILAWVGQAC